MSYDFVKVRKEESYAILMLNRPEVLNAFNTKLRSEVVSALGELEEAEEVRSIILTGEGRAFSAGADIKEIQTSTPVQYRKKSRLGGNEIYRSVAQFPKPTIAAINGYALGGGCELALACDIRLASTEAKLGLPEVTRGLVPGGGGTQRLPRLVGLGLAKELIFTGKLIDAKEAERIGLVNHVYPPEELLRASEELALTIGKNAPFAIRLAKSAIEKSLDVDVNTGLAYETEISTIVLNTQDKEEGGKSFSEKRQPKFTGR